LCVDILGKKAKRQEGTEAGKRYAVPSRYSYSSRFRELLRELKEIAPLWSDKEANAVAKMAIAICEEFHSRHPEHEFSKLVEQAYCAIRAAKRRYESNGQSLTLPMCRDYVRSDVRRYCEEARRSNTPTSSCEESRDFVEEAYRGIQIAESACGGSL
jgi:hypothetical protein